MSEFAKIVGVDHAAVFRAIKRGVRLSKSVVQDEGKTKIVVYDGCLEWHQNKDHRKDRRVLRVAEQLADDDIMEPTEAIKIQRHFDAMTAMLNFTREAGLLVHKDAHKTEVHTYARGVRDSLLFVPIASESEFKRLFVQLLRTHLADDRVSEMQSDLDAAALSFRVHLKDSITKVLNTLTEENLAKDVDEANRVQ